MKKVSMFACHRSKKYFFHSYACMVINDGGWVRLDPEYRENFFFFTKSCFEGRISKKGLWDRKSSSLQASTSPSTFHSDLNMKKK